MLARTNITLKDHKTIPENRKLHCKPFPFFPRWVPLIKIQLAETPLPPGERRALQNKEIILRKVDKSTTTVLMNRENKINEGQEQLDDRNNYQPLDEPMVRDQETHP